VNDTAPTGDPGAPAGREQYLSGLFAQLVMQQTNLTLMLLGQVPHPESGKTLLDLDGARMFIDQLEMIEARTRGNLNALEERLLKQSLTSVRMAFVEAVRQGDTGGEAASNPADSAAPGGSSTDQPPAADASADRRTKFSKSY